MTLDDYTRMRPPVSRWRGEARRVIVSVIQANPGAEPAMLLRLVDAAYPFGERAMEPYKCWLKERKLFREAIATPAVMPSKDEADVCEVARDLVELGRPDEARALLEREAPNRLARRCPACSARPGQECDDLSMPFEAFADLIVPHHARLVGHLDGGPLFGNGADDQAVTS